MNQVGNLIEPPELKAMVLADQIYTDLSGKRVICGTFSRLYVNQLPGVFGRETYTFVLLSGILGKFKLTLRFVNLQDNQVLLQSDDMEFSSPDKLTPVDLAIQVPPFPLPQAGYYSLECWVHDHLVGSVRLLVEKAEQ